MNAEKRVKKYLKKKYENQIKEDKSLLDRLMNYLFWGNALQETDVIPTEWKRGHFIELNNILLSDKPKGKKYRETVMPFLKDFYLIHKFNDDEKLPNFKLIPQFRAGRQYVTYASEAFRFLLVSIGRCPKKPNPNGGKDLLQKYNEIGMTEFLNVKANGFLSKSFVAICIVLNVAMLM